MNIRKFLWLISLSMIVGACKSVQKKAPATSPLQLRTDLVRTESLPYRRSFIGSLESNYSAVIQPRVNGFLITKQFESGMPVQAGDLLFTLDGESLKNSRLAAQAQLESAKAQLLEARNNYERAKPLAEIEAVSRLQLDQYQAQYVAAEAAVRSAEQSLRNSELQVGYTRLFAPIAGMVASSEAHVGDYVGPGTRFEVLTTISNLDTMQVALQLPMREYLDRHDKTSASYRNEGFLSDIRLYLSDGSLYPWRGTYDYTQVNIAESEGTIALVVQFPNPQHLLKAGQFARVEAVVGEPKPYLTIPAIALLEQQGVRSVWVVESDSTLRYQSVTTGPLLGERQAIVSGLKLGDRVLCDGLQKVRQGEKITY